MRGRRALIPVIAALLAVACGGTAGPTDPSSSGAGPAPTSASVPPTTAPPSTAPPTSAAPTGNALPANLVGRVVTVLPTTRRVVALTFDGGASDTGVPAILATLADRGVPATFFVTGDFAARYPGRVRSMAAAGHRIGNHSTTHPDFTGLTADRARQELVRAESAIADLSGRSTRPWFRFPFGAHDPAALGVVNDQGYAAIGWTVDTLGWQGTTEGRSVASVVARVVGTARPGQIVLLHVGAHPQDGSTLDADALPTIIDRLTGLGYGFVTIDVGLA